MPLICGSRTGKVQKKELTTDEHIYSQGLGIAVYLIQMRIAIIPSAE